jgi:hypothetical protein
MLMKRQLLVAATLAACGGWTARVQTAPIVGPTAVVPATVEVGVPTSVTMTAQIPDLTVIPTGVNLLRTDAAGRTLATAGVMHDDGLAGDAVAGDRIFTLRLTIIESSAGQTFYRVSAAFRSVLLRALSPLIPLTASRTAPAISVRLTPGANVHGWNNTPVVAHFTCTGSASATITCPPDRTIATEGANQQVTGMVADSFGQSASITSAPFNIDLTPPAIAVTLTPALPASGTYTSPVTGHFTCTDTLSGIAACPADRTLSSNGTGLTVGGTASDLAGNEAVAAIGPFAIQLPPPPASGVFSVGAEPNWVPSDTSTAVTVTALIPTDDAGKPKSVQVMERDASGLLGPKLATLVDDGSQGDAVAGDDTFTGRVTIVEHGPNLRILVVTATYEVGSELVSTPLVITVRVSDSPGQAISELAQALRNGESGNAYRRLGAALNHSRVLDGMSSDTRSRIATALETCAVTSDKDGLQICAGAETIEGQPQGFRFFILRDAYGVWRVLSW